MEPDEAQRVFEPFIQADPSMRRRYGGTGLGLAIAKSLAQALGGDVRIEKTAKGQGTTISAEFNIEATPVDEQTRSGTPEAKKIEVDKGDLNSKRILVVDDVDDNRVLLRRFLEPSGVHVEMASNGCEALEKASQTELDGVLMDIQMPVMDGIATTEALRHAGFTKPIIAITAHSGREDHERCERAGCTGVITKPVTRDNLLSQLGSFLRRVPQKSLTFV
jgi:CheY-like chemotaxis protein